MRSAGPLDFVVDINTRQMEDWAFSRQVHQHRTCDLSSLDILIAGYPSLAIVCEVELQNMPGLLRLEIPCDYVCTTTIAKGDSQVSKSIFRAARTDDEMKVSGKWVLSAVPRLLPSFEPAASALE